MRESGLEPEKTTNARGAIKQHTRVLRSSEKMKVGLIDAFFASYMQ